MAEALLEDYDQYSCSVCLDLLTDPVTIPCGHSYCMNCINECWNKDQKGPYKCPQCRQIFSSKPPLNRSIVLAKMMEKLRSKESQSLAGPGEIACDVCVGERIKAVKSCLECRASYCETHVQPHYNVPALKKHKLVEATIIPICSKHDKLLEVYCRTDHTCVCMHCLMEDHKGHDTVASTIERNDKQKNLTDTQTKLKQTIQAKEKELQKMTTDITSHSDSAKMAVKTSEKFFTELVKTIEKKSKEVIEKIKAQEKADLDQGERLQEKLKGEITELKKREGALESLLQTDNNIQFLQDFESVSTSFGSDEFPSLSFQPCCCFKDVCELVCDLSERLKITCTQEMTKAINEVSDSSTKRLPSDIKVGDKVRVKSSVDTPTHKWGSVTHKSTGVVKKIQGEFLTVDFSEQKNWTGVVSEMERVTSAELVSDLSTSSSVNIKIGDRVRVKPSVTTPKHNWGRNVTHNCVGVVKDIKGDDSLVVDFPEHADWKGILSEMELATNVDELGSPSLKSSVKIGDKVRVKPSVVSPTHKWGAVNHKSIGVVKKIQGESLTVDFPEQNNWTGVVSEMEVVTSASVDFKIGDQVRVKSSIATPKHNWGAHVTHKSIGVIKEINHDSLIVDFPEHASWKGLLSEMELVTSDDEFGSSSLKSSFKIGDKVCVKPSVVTPTHKWGAVTHKSIGVVQKIQGTSLIVDFPEHKKWTGVVSEMKLVTKNGSGLSSSLDWTDNFKKQDPNWN